MPELRESFQQPQPGLFLVRYDDRDALDPARQGPLVDAMRYAGTGGPVAIVFLVGPAVRTIDLAVPAFWLGVVASRSPEIAGLAIVSPALAVRIAASSFGAAARLAGHGVAVHAFEREPEAVAWASERVTPGVAPA